MMHEVFKFEVNYHRRQYLFYVLSGVLTAPIGLLSAKNPCRLALTRSTS